MTLFNPLSGTILGSTQAQRQLQVEKERQVRREQALSRNVAAEDDRLEHQVESTDRIARVHDERPPRQSPTHHPSAHESEDGNDQPHVDIKG